MPRKVILSCMTDLHMELLIRKYKGNRIFMKKYYLLLLLLLFSTVLFLGCGEEKKYELTAEYEGLVFENDSNTYFILGEQYYNGSKIRLTATRDGSVLWCEDGKESEVFMTGVDEAYLNVAARWWVDSTGQVYVLCADTVTLLDGEGRNCASVNVTDGTVTNVCESSQGKVVVVIRNSAELTNGLAVLDMEQQTVTNTVWYKESISGLDTGKENDILIADTKGICDYSLAEQKGVYYIEWGSSPYKNAGLVQGIRMISENQLELFLDKSVLMTLKKVIPEDTGKTILTYKAVAVPVKMKEMIARFNQENDEYYIQVSELGEGMDYKTFQGKVQTEIAAGYGPDILSEFSVLDLQALQNKGVLEELTPYVDSGELDKNDYFPICFSGQKEIYGIVYGMTGSALYINAREAAAPQSWDIDSLLGFLETCPDNRRFAAGADAAEVLDILIRYSDNLQGMVDWENHTCDFSKERWERLLQVALRYGECQENRGADCIAVLAYFYNFGAYAAYDTAMEQKGMVMAGYPTENAGANYCFGDSLYMNAASGNQEGVWQFFLFLLREDIQKEMHADDIEMSFPVNRRAFTDAGKEWTARHHFTALLAEPEIYSYEFTEAQLAEAEVFMENAGTVSGCPLEIRNIIREETQAYFNGDKSMEEVNEVIQNRVQLYLNEK